MNEFNFHFSEISNWIIETIPETYTENPPLLLSLYLSWWCGLMTKLMLFARTSREFGNKLLSSDPRRDQIRRKGSETSQTASNTDSMVVFGRGSLLVMVSSERAEWMEGQTRPSCFTSVGLCPSFWRLAPCMSRNGAKEFAKILCNELAVSSLFVYLLN